jgi:hypothetical protein
MNFDSVAHSDHAILRFPDAFDGVDLWKRTVAINPDDVPNFGSPTIKLKRPRLFVSYKTQNRQYALRLAYLADQAGFNFWLDVLDPALQGANAQPMPAKRRAILVASAIEIGLLNSSHLIAVITKQTAASRWVPYEFGRVKSRSVVSSDASSWVHRSDVPSMPEYLYLCPIHFSETEIKQWLISECSKWERNNRVLVSKPAGQWILPAPQPLP